MIDFRDCDVNYIERKLQSSGFNIEKIKNFKKEFSRQFVSSIEEIKNVKNISNIAKILPYSSLSVVETVKDRENNEKFVFKTHDGLFIESVLMKSKKSLSVCVSTQIGCKIGCLICNTGKVGFIRNLLPHEIVEQVRMIYLTRVFPYNRISCVSFMGMGEPFDNLDSCMRALDWITSDWGFNISRKKVTFSTSGCIDFYHFFSYKKLPNLAISLHSASDEKRMRIMPKAKISLNELKQYMHRYVNITKKQISIEYCLIKDFNDSDYDINLLIEFTKDIPCKINLINYNPISYRKYQSVSNEKIENIISMFKEKNKPCIYRKSLAIEAGAACGQLGESLLVR